MTELLPTSTIILIAKNNGINIENDKIASRIRKRKTQNDKGPKEPNKWSMDDRHTGGSSRSRTIGAKGYGKVHDIRQRTATSGGFNLKR